MIDASLFWTEENQENACRDGWLLIQSTEIQRLDCDGHFPNDAAAKQHVRNRALQGSALHKKAIGLATGTIKPVDAEALFQSMLQSKKYQSLVNAGRQIARNKAKRLDYTLSVSLKTLLVADATDQTDYPHLAIGHNWTSVAPCDLATIKV